MGLGSCVTSDITQTLVKMGKVTEELGSCVTSDITQTYNQRFDYAFKLGSCVTSDITQTKVYFTVIGIRELCYI